MATTSTEEAQDFKIECMGVIGTVKIEVSQGAAQGKREAYIDITISGKKFRLEAKSTPEDRDGGDLVINVAKVALVDSNGLSVRDILGDPRISVIVDKDGVREMGLGQEKPLGGFPLTHTGDTTDNGFNGR